MTVTAAAPTEGLTPAPHRWAEENPGPCVDCPQASRCAAELLACSDFALFCHRGKYAALAPRQPTRAIFEKLYPPERPPRRRSRVTSRH